MAQPNSVFAGGQGENATAGEVVVTLVHDKGGNPNYQPFFEKQAVRMTADIGIQLEASPYPTTDVYTAAVRSSLLGSDAPELFSWWSTYRIKELVDQGLIADLTDMWDTHADQYSPGIRQAYTFDEKVYGFPYSLQYWAVFYNKEVFAQHDLSPPSTWEEFIEICDILVAHDVTPLLQSVQGRWVTFINFEEFIIGQDPDLYDRLMVGKARYTDPAVRAAFELWRSMIQRGYYTAPSVDVFADAPRMFNDGKLAMAVMGTWYYTAVLTANGVPEENIGLFVLPSHNPAAGKNVIFETEPVFVSAHSKNVSAAKQVAGWWMDAPNASFFAEMLTAYPANSAAEADFLPTEKVNLFTDVTTGGYRFLNRFWEATPVPISEAAVDKFAEFILDPSKLDSILEDLDDLASDYWAKNK